MVLTAEILFIACLGFLLFMLHKNEKAQVASRLSHAVIEEYWDGKDRRKHMRFKKTLDVIYGLERRPHLKKNGKTVDISEGGARLMLDKKLEKGTILDLKIGLPGAKNMAELEGKVAWSEEAIDKDGDGKRWFHAGIEFIALKEPHRSSFIDYIRSLYGHPQT